jgi:hypothetical protein
MTWGVQRNKSNLVISGDASLTGAGDLHLRKTKDERRKRHRYKTGISFYLHKLSRVEQEKEVPEVVPWKKAGQIAKVSWLRRQQTAMCNKTCRALAQSSDEMKRKNNKTLRATQDSLGILSPSLHSLVPGLLSSCQDRIMRWKEYHKKLGIVKNFGIR